MKYFRTKKERKQYYERLLARRSNIEFNNDGKEEKASIAIAGWKTFYSLSEGEQKRRRVEWDAYYARVRQSVSALMYKEMHGAISLGNWEEFRSLADQARRMKEDGTNITLPMPKHADPYAIDNDASVREYLSLEREIKELTLYV